MKISDLIQLNELRIHGAVDLSNPPFYIFMYQGDVWVFASDTGAIPPEDRPGILRAIDPEYVRDISHLRDVVGHAPNTLFGLVTKDRILHMQGKYTNDIPLHIAQTSPDIRKLVKQLRLRGVAPSTDDSTELPNGDTTNPPPVETGSINDGDHMVITELYHGTSSKDIVNILKHGLIPGEKRNQTNFNNVTPKPVVFGAVEYDVAVFHANRTVSTALLSNQWTGKNLIPGKTPFPIVLKFKVPDPNRIYPDYDVAVSLIQPKNMPDKIGYKEDPMTSIRTMFQSEYLPQKDPNNRFWRRAGMFAYRGRIPASFIIEVHTNFWDGPVKDEVSDWVGTPEEFLKELADRKNQS